MTTTEHPRIAWKRGKSRVLHGDCLAELKRLHDNSIDAIVTDPPYGLSTLRPDAVADVITHWAAGDREYMPQARGFLGKSWDGFVPPPAVWDECLRVLKPGGHMAVFAGSRTVDLMGIAIRLAGFEIRDTLGYLYGNGFPKSLNVGKAIDKAEGAVRPVVGTRTTGIGTGRGGTSVIGDSANRGLTAPATDDAKRWHGWGTALKPAIEPIILARKPVIGTVAENVLLHGTGAIHIDACRIDASDGPRVQGAQSAARATQFGGERPGGKVYTQGRWPANIVLDESAAADIDAQSGHTKSRRATVTSTPGDVYGASRFFYCAKASKRERPVSPDGTKHPTVKPLSLMTWLLKLITPPGGIVLDPFGGSGTTAEAALLQRIPFVTIERDPAYIPLILSRLERSTPTKKSA